MTIYKELKLLKRVEVKELIAEYAGRHKAFTEKFITQCYQNILVDVSEPYIRKKVKLAKIRTAAFLDNFLAHDGNIDEMKKNFGEGEEIENSIMNLQDPENDFVVDSIPEEARS